MQMYAIYDRKLEAFLPPFNARTDGLACRSFVQSVGAADSVVAQFPQDFALYRVGAFEDLTGVFTSERIELMDGLAAVREVSRLREVFRKDAERATGENYDAADLAELERVRAEGAAKAREERERQLAQN